MKALILNSGLGSRMGAMTSEHPKCMTKISNTETILSRQLKFIAESDINEVVITTGYHDDVLVNYCKTLDLPLKITYVKNDLYDKTNYIYSIYRAKEYLDDDIILMHGDLVFESSVFDAVLSSEKSCMTISSSIPLPEKDFKAVVKKNANGTEYVSKVGIEFFDEAKEAQAFYKLNKKDWIVWLNEIVKFCENKFTNCYAENALNEVSDMCMIYPLDIKDSLCAEIDNLNDLSIVKEKLKIIEERTVYMCFSTDMVHSGHIAIIKKAKKLGKLIIGVLSDEAVVSYKRFPLLPFSERKALFENISGVYKVVEQKTLSYKEIIEKYHPTYVVHGNDWVSGFQKPVREEVLTVLATYGGQLVEFPYSRSEKYDELENRAKSELSIPDVRRSRLKKIFEMKGFATAMEAHSGLTGLIVEKTVVNENGGAHQFDAMWVSSLCDSTAKGKPDIELVDMTSRFRTIDDIMEVTTKPIVFDGDTGGLTEHFVYTVRSLERMGVSMVIIEDKTGIKKNSLFGTDVPQTQDTIENFCTKISAGKKVQKTKDFMICARCEGLILEKGIEDTLIRAFAYVEAGADAIMIHSRKESPSEIFEFIEKFRLKDKNTYIVVVPTSYNTVTEDELRKRGVNLVIYANQLTRSGFPAMQNAAKLILKNHRAKECDDICMSIKEIINLIPVDI